ncbi:hypothetical protein EYF80_013303 [Liparis tanakae]|uniref:Uncharacterized protein n=1 Tax=Liparis tanakae TaxID=230148 RepID=A0A4Z2IEM7_9TELE|nr:hypothetical protein EYF80_013303 [Liparis tanakae]
MSLPEKRRALGVKWTRRLRLGSVRRDSVTRRNQTNGMINRHSKLQRGPDPNVASSCLNDNQEEGDPARFFSVAPVEASPPSPATQPG